MNKLAPVITAAKGAGKLVKYGYDKLFRRARGVFSTLKQPIKDKVLRYAAVATGIASSAFTVEQFYELFTTKDGAAIGLQAFTQAGVNPADVLDSAMVNDIGDEGIANLQRSLIDQYHTLYSGIDDASMIGSSGDPSQAIIAMEVIKDIESYFGVRDAGVRQLHAKLRMFLAMSDDAVATALALRQAAR